MILRAHHLLLLWDSTFEATQHDKYIAMSRDAVAASVADVSACVVRVPCETRLNRWGRGKLPCFGIKWGQLGQGNILSVS